jgi:hypothetical protein
MAEIFAFAFAMVCYYFVYRFIKYLCIQIIAYAKRSEVVNLDDSFELTNNVIPLSEGGSPIEPIIDFNRNIFIADQDASAQTLLAKYMHDEFDLKKNHHPMAMPVYPFKKLKVLQLARAKLIAKENDLHRVPFAYNR